MPTVTGSMARANLMCDLALEAFGPEALQVPAGRRNQDSLEAVRAAVAAPPVAVPVAAQLPDRTRRAPAGSAAPAAWPAAASGFAAWAAATAGPSAASRVAWVAASAVALAAGQAVE